MKVITKRTLSLLMSLMLVVSLFVGVAVPAQAAGNVTYKYSGKYVYNWGTRGTTATFLSPMAEEFYQKNNVTFEQLAAYAGHTSTGSVPSSNLYKQLQTLMKSNHKTITSYDDTRPLFQYTDSQNNIKNSNRISAFYSGSAVGPAWDSGATWNREHVWPNSKGDQTGQGENDIMMLRPETASNNSSRGNKAYGESSGFYDPNGLGQNVRGDAARILLYTYVRWGGTQKMWGSSGVMESKDILLKWIKEDPVDTWELARNDAVQSITGTRNVFVDYPQLVFELFETATPANYQTPSGKTAGGNVTNDPNQPDIPTVNPDDSGSAGVITDPQVGVAYKLGLYSTDKSATYYATGAMKDYYGATDTSVDAAADFYLESTTGGYYLYTTAGGSKQYINLVYTGTHYNYTYAASASSVYTWDTEKNALSTIVNNEVCYIGTYGTYVTMGVLTTSKMSDGNYIARLYGANGAGGSTGGDTPDTPDVPVVEPTANSYLTIAEAAALGAGKSKDEYTEGKYYVTGIIESVDNATFGNMTITDGNGNDLYVYGTYNNDGTVGYSALNPKPVVGDTVTLYGVIGMYNEAQMKSAWIVAHIPGANPDQPSVSGSATLSFDDGSKRTSYSTEQQVWQDNGITLTNDKASSSTNIRDWNAATSGNGDKEIRVYKGSSVTIAYPGMIKIVVTATDGSAYSKDYVGPWTDSFTDSNATVEVNGFEVTITFANPVDSFTWTSMTNQARAYSFEVFDGSEDANHTHEYDNDCDATCNTCGAVRIANHVYDDNFDATCNKCGAARPVADPNAQCYHAYDNDCDKSCNLCGETRTVGAHSYKKVIVKKATTSANGSYKNVCSVCGYTASKIVTIYKASSVKLSKTSYTYNGKVQKPSVTVKDSKGNKVSSSYYTVKYAGGCKSVGTYKVTVTFKGRYSGTKALSYKIKAISVADCKISLSKTAYTYNGKVQKPAVIVKNAKGTKLTTSSYTVTYASGRKNVGLYKVTVKMKGNYSGTKIMYFKINPPKTDVKTVTPGKKSLKVGVTKKSTQVTGYQIQCSTSTNFKNYKAVQTSSYKNVYATLKNLSANKVYYVRVRTYKVVDGKKYYSAWSTIKYKKTK